jgi:hypothetical protein
MDENLKKKYLPFILNFSSLVKRAALYSPAHPVVVSSLREVYPQLADVLSGGDFHLTVTEDKKVLANGEPLVVNESIISGVLPYLRKWRIEEISFKTGVSEQELHAFLGILLWNDAMVAATGDVSLALQRQSIAHIELNLFSYKKVRKDEEVIGKVPESEPFPKKKEKSATELLKDKLKDLFRKRPEDVLKNMETVRTDLCSIVTTEIKEHKKVSASTKALLEKYIFQSQDMATFLTKLREKLIESGISEEEADTFVRSLQKTLEQALVPKPAPTVPTAAVAGVDALKEENERLRFEVKTLRREIEEKQRVIDDLSKRVPS